MRGSGRSRRGTDPLCAAVLGVALLGALAGCAAEPVAAPVRSGPRPPAAPEATAPADEQRAAFDAVARAVIARKHAPVGMDFVRALIASGADPSRLQVTPDRTAVGLAVPSVQFSLRRRRSCLVGQFGPDRAYRTVRLPAADGVCLLGRTRPIDG